jgi:long-chain fatty acid transport protein
MDARRGRRRGGELVIRARAPLAAFTIALCAAATATASPVDTVGIGSRSIGRAGAVSADVDDFSANYYNPAGLARGDSLRIDVGYVRLHSNFEINGEDSGVEPLGALNVGIVAPGQFGKLRFAFGLGLLLNDQRMSRTRSAITNRPRWELYDTRMHKVFLATNLAIRPVDWLIIGGGITFQAPSELTLQLEGSTIPFVPTSTRVEHMFTGDLTSIRYPQVGIQIVPHGGFSFGVTYRGEFLLENTVNAKADVDLPFSPDVDLGLLLDLTSVSRAHFGPQQLSMGAAYERKGLRASFELTWMNWSKHPSLISDDTIDLELIDPSGFAAGLGIQIPDEIAGNRAVPMGMKDTWIPRVSVEGRVFDGKLADVTVRGGYYFERSPFPTQRGVTNFIDNDRHNILVGGEIAFDELKPLIEGGVFLNFHFLYAHLPERTHVKTSLVDPVGDLVSRGHQFGFGTQLSVRFK